MMKYQKTFCSQCGGEFGAGDAGFSSCVDHMKGNKDLMFAQWYDSLEGTKSQGFAYKVWCAGWSAAVLAEREACAKLCEEFGALEALEGEKEMYAALIRVADRQSELCAVAIRRRTE